MAWVRSINDIGDELGLLHSPDWEESFSDLHMTLNEAKSKIDGEPMWHNKKKLANPYEMISSNYRKGNIRVLYKPFSRSYFKMWEILKDYNLLPNRDAINVACLAEGPGGFMEAIINQRENLNDRVIGVTLAPRDHKIPGWNKLKKELSHKSIYIQKCLKVVYGNLYMLPDILTFAKMFKGEQQADLITADGGFDFSTDYNGQENMAQHLIFAEIVAALTLQKVGGNFVCKVYDLFSTISVKILYLITVHYEETFLVKPKVSRPANSEKYIVAKNFKGISEVLLKDLYLLLIKWDNSVMNIHGIECNTKFIKVLRKYNEGFVTKQISSIENTMNLITEKVSTEKFMNILNNQRKNAIDWCQRYSIPFTYGAPSTYQSLA